MFLLGMVGCERKNGGGCFLITQLSDVKALMMNVLWSVHWKSSYTWCSSLLYGGSGGGC